MSPEQGNTDEDGFKEARYESRHVHQVYDKIATHFSATRYKPWPIVEKFLNSLPLGAVGLDMGCGNGKYLNINPNIFILGSDRCGRLVEIAQQHAASQDVVNADIMDPPYRPSTFDFALSIAVIHHLSTARRRIEAIASILGLLKPGGEGKALVYVWALEQRTSRRGWDENSNQDVLVPWVLGKQFKESQPAETDSFPQKTANDEPILRFYHLYKKGELESDVKSAGGKIIAAGYEKDNWWAVFDRA
ncbi:tRNA methyltransferase, has a role in tRNA modification [Orbilia ellipsospora]|uniref:tRNA methyltransferase, has a role in tRNA modification n=1 Tax=Orbilia ellipsospora TaxID=2528407 RepID=A0AAV9X2G4_9PEZI